MTESSQPGLKSNALLSLVIPCYNEEAVLPRLFERVTAAADQLGCPWEVICVDDGSRDGTWRMLSEQHRKDARWRAVRFSRNFGHQTALTAGMTFARGDAVVLLDADLQDPPEQIPKLVGKWREGYEVVYTVHTKRQDAALKQLFAWGFYRVMSRLVPFDVPADSADFCLLDRKVVNVLNVLPERSRYLRGLRTWCGFRQTGVEFERDARVAGTAQYSFLKSFRLAMDGIFSFSSTPLRLATWLGILACFFALAGAVIACWRDDSVLVFGMLFLGGAQLICLGILGEYLGRIYDEVKGRPRWIIQETAGATPP